MIAAFLRALFHGWRQLAEALQLCNTGNDSDDTGAGVAGMAKLADAADLKSAGPKGLWGFDSPSRHQIAAGV